MARLQAAFADLGIGVLASAVVGGRDEWLLFDSEGPFKCLIASGTGHAYDR